MNIFYLLLSFPLGLFYFTFLVTGLSLGAGLVITFLGIPILFGTLLLWRVFGGFERQLAVIMLKIKIPFKPLKKSKKFWENIKLYFTDSFTWKSLTYLFIKFPLGIVSFVILVTLFSVSLSLVAVPILYYLTRVGTIAGNFCIGTNGVCFINNYFNAIIVGIVGVFLVFVSLHAINGIARIFGLLTKALLGK